MTENHPPDVDQFGFTPRENRFHHLQEHLHRNRIDAEMFAGCVSLAEEAAKPRQLAYTLAREDWLEAYAAHIRRGPSRVFLAHPLRQELLAVRRRWKEAEAAWRPYEEHLRAVKARYWATTADMRDCERLLLEEFGWTHKWGPFKPPVLRLAHVEE
jgi:hypothetical protein